MQDEPVGREVQVGRDVKLRLDAAGKFESVSVANTRPLARSGVVRVSDAKALPFPITTKGLRVRYWSDDAGRVTAIEVF